SETVAQRDRPQVETICVQRAPQRVDRLGVPVASRKLQTQLSRDELLIELLQRSKRPESERVTLQSEPDGVDVVRAHLHIEIHAANQNLPSRQIIQVEQIELRRAEADRVALDRLDSHFEGAGTLIAGGVGRRTCDRRHAWGERRATGWHTSKSHAG